MPAFDQEFHDVLSRLLRDYPKLWRPRGGPQCGLYQELAEKVSQEMQRQVSAKKVKNNLKEIRRRLERLDQGSSTQMKTCAYLWYAQELGYVQAAEVMSTLCEKQKSLGLEKEDTFRMPEDNDGLSTSAGAAPAQIKRRRAASPEAVSIKQEADDDPLTTAEGMNAYITSLTNSEAEELCEKSPDPPEAVYSKQDANVGPFTTAEGMDAYTTGWTNSEAEELCEKSPDPPEDEYIKQEADAGSLTTAEGMNAYTTGWTNSEAGELCEKYPDPSTKDFIFQHTMYRIKDPRKSLPFYTGVLGMTLLQKLDFPEAKFSLYFMGYENSSDVPNDSSERTKWAMSRKATIELTHNWGTESDPDQKYHTGNADPWGFGHIGIMVPDVYAACKRFENLGVDFIKKPDEGRIKGLAFIKDPDGYWIEVFNANTSCN